MVLFLHRNTGSPGLLSVLCPELTAVQEFFLHWLQSQGTHKPTSHQTGDVKVVSAATTKLRVPDKGRSSFLGVLIVTVPWDQEHQVSWSPEQGGPQVSPEQQLQKMGHHRNVKVHFWETKCTCNGMSFNLKKKNETLPFVTTCRDLEDTMLSEIARHSYKDKYCWYHSHVFVFLTMKQNKTHSQIQRTDWWLPEVEDEGGRIR